MSWLSRALRPSATPPASLRGQSPHVGHRRDQCWWEPIYSPGLVLDADPYDWKTDRDAGPHRRLISGATLNSAVVPGDAFKITDVTFRECDFQGTFKPETLVMFDRCRFVGCDFALSNWRDTHFRKCTFTASSLSLSTFDRCEFRDCEWQQIGMGSKTELTKTFINNPAELIFNTVSNRNPNDDTLKHRMYQWHRLQGTRAHFLRIIMISHQSAGEEHAYYATVRLHELQRSIARMSEDIFKICFNNLASKISSFLNLLLHAADNIILRTFGWLNNWGESASRPCFALIGCFITFAAVYHFADFNKPIAHFIQKSFDITFLVGYGNQVLSSDENLSIIQDLHAVVAIAIYSVFFATVISKLSRAR